MLSDNVSQSFVSVSSETKHEKIMMTDIDYTDRLEKNVKELQEMALEISKQGRTDKINRKDWTQKNKD